MSQSATQFSLCNASVSTLSHAADRDDIGTTGNVENNHIICLQTLAEITIDMLIATRGVVAKNQELINRDPTTGNYYVKGLSCYGLFKETVRVFLQNLRKHKPGLCEGVIKELSRDYLANEFDLTAEISRKSSTPNTGYGKGYVFII